MAWFKGKTGWLTEAEEDESWFTKRAYLPPAAREHNFLAKCEVKDGLANCSSGKEEYLVSPTKNPCRIHRVGEGPRDFLPEYQNTASYYIQSL